MLDISKIQYYIDKGMYHKDWYTDEPQKLFKLLPEFSEIPILRVFAVTSMTTSIEANVHLAVKALLQWKRGEQFTGYIKNQVTYLNMIRDGKDVPGRKIMSFIKALEGDINSVVVDIWMCRAFGLAHRRKFKNREYWLAPSKKEYDLIENFCREDAKRIGVEPRQYQSIIWGAIKKEQGIVSSNVTWSALLMKKKGMFCYEP
jgi:hypothetical protein